MQKSTTDISAASLGRFVVLATQAGKAVGTKRQDEVCARLLLSEELPDATREGLGYAAHVVTQAKKTGKTPIDLWRSIQTSLGAADNKPLELKALDDVQLGLLAFAAGVCRDDRATSRDIQQYVRRVVQGRQLTAV
jgi:hypothetical protein